MNEPLSTYLLTQGLSSFFTGLWSFMRRAIFISFCPRQPHLELHSTYATSNHSSMPVAVPHSRKVIGLTINPASIPNFMMVFWQNCFKVFYAIIVSNLIFMVDFPVSRKVKLAIHLNKSWVTRIIYPKVIFHYKSMFCKASAAQGVWVFRSIAISIPSHFPASINSIYTRFSHNTIVPRRVLGVKCE